MASAIEAMLKVRYGDFINPLPSEDTIAADVPFVPKEARMGRTYNFPVYLGMPHGQTHDDTKTAFSLNAVRSPTVVEASLTGASLLIRDNVSYDDVFATKNGIADGGGAGGAYMDAWDYCTFGLMQAGELYRELDLMWGPGNTSTAAANIGVVSASISGANLAAPQVVELTQESWIPGLWPNMTTALVDIYQSDGTTPRETSVTVTAVTDETTNRLTLTKAASAATVAAGDVIIVRGALDVSCFGLSAIGENSGSLHGISAATYPQWRCASHSAGDLPLDRAQIIAMSAKQVPRGVKTGATLYVSAPCMSDLIEEALELQRFEGEDEVKVQGASAVSYKTPAGRVNAKLYPYMKQGNFLWLPKDNAKRVGSTDLTFSNGKNEWFYQELADNAGSQLRIFSSQAPVLTKPWQAIWGSNVRSTYDTAPV